MKENKGLKISAGILLIAAGVFQVYISAKGLPAAGSSAMNSASAFLGFAYAALLILTGVFAFANLKKATGGLLAAYILLQVIGIAIHFGAREEGTKFAFGDLFNLCFSLACLLSSLFLMLTCFNAFKRPQNKFFIFPAVIGLVTFFYLVGLIPVLDSTEYSKIFTDYNISFLASLSLYIGSMLRFLSITRQKQPAVSAPEAYPAGSGNYPCVQAAGVYQSYAPVDQNAAPFNAPYVPAAIKAQGSLKGYKITAASLFFGAAMMQMFLMILVSFLGGSFGSILDLRALLGNSTFTVILAACAYIALGVLTLKCNNRKALMWAVSGCAVFFLIIFLNNVIAFYLSAADFTGDSLTLLIVTLTPSFILLISLLFLGLGLSGKINSPRKLFFVFPVCLTILMVVFFVFLFKSGAGSMDAVTGYMMFIMICLPTLMPAAAYMFMYMGCIPAESAGDTVAAYVTNGQNQGFTVAMPITQSSSSGDDAARNIQKLYELKTDGIITEAEFEEKRQIILSKR